ncbi:MAG: DoxX family protein [Pseudomonadota bacterium]
MSSTSTTPDTPQQRNAAGKLIAIHNVIFGFLERMLASWLIPSLARLLVAAVLLGYFWSSALTKLGDGFFGWLFPSSGAYVQMFPKAMEAVSYDQTALGFHYYLIALFGTWTEFILPLLIVVGLFTRLASIGLIGFIVVMSLTDVLGHAADAATLGNWFDKSSGSLIADQRSLWIFMLIVLVLRGGGPFSLDRFLIEKPSKQS